MPTDSDRIEYSDPGGSDPVTADQLEQPGGGMRSHTDRLLETGVPEDVGGMVEGEMNEDHVLGNLEDGELWERRFNIMNNEEFLLAMYPPEESVLQGDVRERFGLPGPKHALDPTAEHELSDSRDAAYARATRSRDGFQQEMMVKSITEMHRVDGELDDGSNGRGGGGGILGGLLGGAK